ncbi:MAG: NAD(P)-binding protein [Lachnospiraceae bacterium]|nr:NAD(P)-binding protein [Lachnospiraceae bacterium]
MKKVIIIGAGPAGITAGYELLKQSNEYEVTILEESSYVGGISRTEVYNGHRMDIGGHRFFSKSQEVNDWWEQIMPMQGAPAYDDDKLSRDVPLEKGGPDPEKVDRVMLNRSRISHIYYKRKFFEYPVRMNMDTIKNMGFGTTMQAGFSYLGSMVAKKPVNSLENFYINQFGRKLYSMFFEGYTEKLWGRHPREIDPSWGAQRTKGLSITEIVKDATRKAFHKETKDVNTSLIGAFKYPKLGPGQLWECAAVDFEAMGGSIHYNCQVIRINTNGNQVESVTCAVDGITIEEKADIVISSMPIKDLIIGMSNVPGNVSEVARKLPYRDFVTVGLLVPKLRISNTTYMRTLGNVIPDTWIYVQDPGIKMGRIQIFNNWSPYLLENPEKTVWVGLEYFCNEGDRYWNMTDDEWIEFATKELIHMGILSESAKVLDAHKVAVKKAYPAYFDTYARFDEIRTYLDGFENLYCVGRNGQHRYNNMDHSMITAFETVKNIINGVKDKSNIWNVNTEQEYHEEKATTEDNKTAEEVKTTAAPVPPVKEVQKAAEGAVVAASVAASVPAPQPVKKEEELQATVQAVPAPPVRKQLRRNPLPKETVEATNNQVVVPVPVVEEQPVLNAVVNTEMPVAQPVVAAAEPEVAVVSQEAEIHVSRSRSIWDDVEYAEATAAVKTAPIRFKSVEEAHAAVKGGNLEKKAEKKIESDVIEEKEVNVEEVKEKNSEKKRNSRKKSASTKEETVETVVKNDVEETTEVKKPSRTRRKKATEETVVVEKTETTIIAETDAETKGSEEQPAEVKKTSRSRRKKPVEVKEESVVVKEENIETEKLDAVSKETVEVENTDAVIAETKKPSRSRRKKPVEIAEMTSEEMKTEAVEAVAEEVKAEVVEEAKIKVVEEVVAEETKVEAVEEVVAEEVKAEVAETIEEAKSETVVEEIVEEAKPETVVEEIVEEVKDEVAETVAEEVTTEVAVEVVEDVKVETAEEKVAESDVRRNYRSTSGKTIAGRTASRRVSNDKHASNRRKVEDNDKKVSNIGKEAVVGNMKGTVIKSNVIQKTPDNNSSNKKNKR